MDGPKKATVYFHLQYYLTVADSPGSLDTGLESYSGYYDYCSNITIVAPDPVPDPSDPLTTQWVFDQWYLASVFDVFNTTVTVHIEHATTVGKTLYAIYTKEYYLEVADDIGDLSGASALSGWFAAGAVVPLGVPDQIDLDATSRYMFVEWIKDPGHYTATTNGTTITMNSPRNATAYYKKQYKVTWTADPSFLNAQIGGFPGSNWLDENVAYWWGAPSGPLASSPFDYIFDHWEMNGVPEAQYASSVLINTTGPITGVAYYLGMSAFFISPQMVIVDAPAECTTFTVNVTAANVVDLYAFDFNVTWDPTLIELVDVDYCISTIWGSYYEAKKEINNTAGYFWYVATSLDGAPDDPYGFNGTSKIVTLTFHIIYDPCYLTIDYFRECDIELNVKKLADSNGDPMSPHNIHGGYYRINAIQPVIQMRPSTVTVSAVGTIFQVEIWIVNATKLHDYFAYIEFNTTHLDILSVEVDTTFLTGPYEIFQIWKSDEYGFVEIWIVQQQPGEVLANGEGKLATLTFNVTECVMWTTPTLPDLHSWIEFDYVYISVKCPTYAEIWPSALAVEDCEFFYLPIPGDVNCDGIVNVLDLQLVASEYGDCSTYDLNEDGEVELLDLVIVAINYGRDEP
jgi:hypothetical protein